MTVCANRPNESPGFFTPCRQCPCGKEVQAELEAAEAASVLDNQENPCPT